MVSDRAFLVVGGLGAVALLLLVWKGSKAVEVVAEKAGDVATGVKDFVSNDNFFSDANNNLIETASGGYFSGLHDVMYWMTGGYARDEAALNPPPLYTPTTAK